MVRPVQGSDHLRILDLRALDVFPHSFSRGRDALAVEQAFSRQLGHEGLDAAGLVEILDVVRAAGRHGAEMGHLASDLIEEFDVEIHSRRMGDRGQVQGRVRRAAQGEIHGYGVFESLPRKNIPRLNVLFHEIHDSPAGILGQAVPGGVYGWNRAVAGKAYAEGFHHAVHGVGGEHARTGAAARAGGVFNLQKFLVGSFTDNVLADRFEDRVEIDLLAVEQSCQHGTAGYYDRRDIEPRRGHGHAGYYLVAIGHQHQAVEGMGPGHHFHRIHYQLPGRQGVLHAYMVHGDSVADPDGGELDGQPPRGVDTRLDRVHDPAQMDMAGYYLVIRVSHPYPGPLYLPIGIARRLHQGTVRGALGTFFRLIASHYMLLFLVLPR